jgi:acyl-coenzyme A thioesterase PaaI-like protein
MNIRRFIWTTRLLSDKQRLEWYPPLWMMRIKVLELSDDWRHIRIRLPQTWLSRNRGGSLFGGFQACLADPIAAMACVKLFPNRAVWTRGLLLDFQIEGNTDLELVFRFSAEQEQKIRQELDAKGRSTPTFEYGYYRTDGKLCTRIEATVAIRPKGYKKPVKPCGADGGTGKRVE